MTRPHAPGNTCARCGHSTYPHEARRTEEGWRHLTPKNCRAAIANANRDARAEDIRFMAAHGESLYGAARRLGLGTGSLDKWMRNNGLTAEAETMLARNPVGVAWEHRNRDRVA